jgi:glycosyltransferase involved in cell wall biosynthesis
MNIVLFHHGRVPVEKYGGTERVVLWLARGLAELGHAVTVIAGRGSRLAEARVIEVDSARAARADFDLRPLLPAGAEVIHAHQRLHLAEVPSLWTLHGNTRTPPSELPANMVCLSRNHAERHHCPVFVHNGLDGRDYRFSATKEPFDLFLGRLHTAKGWRWAMQGAERCGRELRVAGGWRPSFRRGLSFLGEIGGEQKIELLAKAAVLWMPAQWEEPFGLTLIEAMVSGTPVLGTRRGALPEIVSPEVGALGDDLDELVALRPTLDAIDPEACRRRAETLFSHRAMAERYLELYRRVVTTGTVAPPRP